MDIQEYIAFAENPENWGKFILKEVKTNTVERVQKVDAEGKPVFDVVQGKQKTEIVEQNGQQVEKLVYDKDDKPVFELDKIPVFLEVPTVIVAKVELTPNNGTLEYRECNPALLDYEKQTLLNKVSNLDKSIEAIDKTPVIKLEEETPPPSE